MIQSECIRNVSVTPRNTEYTKYDPPGAQVSDDALAQKYLLYTPPARLKLRYRYLRAYFFNLRYSQNVISIVCGDASAVPVSLRWNVFAESCHTLHGFPIAGSESVYCMEYIWV